MRTRETLNRITSGPKKRLTLAAFSAALYASAVAASVPVAKYDFSDFAGMYQDNLGVLPVTAVEQPIGMILDKSRGFVRGAELVVNGNMSSGTGWTLAGSAAITAGVLAITAGTAGSAQATNTGTLVPGKTYELSFEITAFTAGGVSVGTSGAAGTTRTTVGVYREIFTAGSGSSIIVYARNTATTATVDNVTVKEIPGTPLTQATSTARPIVDGRVNALVQTEVFSNAAWAKTNTGTASAPTVTDNFGLAPDGTTTAARVQMALNGGVTTSDYCVLYQPTPVQNAGKYSTGFWLKTNDGTTKNVIYRDDISAPSNSPVLSVTGTWQFFSFLNVASTNTNAHACKLWLRGGLGTADSADLLIWHPQYEGNPTLSRYQRVTTAATYDAVGFPVTARFDGVDDCLFSPVNFDMSSASKMTVIAGVVKNSDAARSCILESNNSFAVVGSFGLFGSFTPGTEYMAAVTGSSASANTNLVSGFAAPHTAVVTASLNLAGATAIERVGIRINGTPPTGTVSGAAAGGNFVNAPIYAGRRANTSIPFNGKIATIDIVGRLISPDEQYNLERLARQKLTGNML